MSQPNSLLLIKSLKTQGQEADACGDFETSVEAYSKALQILLDVKLAPLYVLYGNGLLQLAIKNSTEALLNTEVGPKNFASEDESGSSSEENGEKQEDPAGSVAREADIEEADDFSMAWEVLDTARVIYERDVSLPKDEKLSRLVDIFGLLGDLSMEIENFNQARDDISKAIECASSKESRDVASKRAIASMYFRLAIACEYSSSPSDAVECLTKSRDLMEECIAELSKECSSEKDVVDYDQLADLKALVPEIDEKIKELLSGDKPLLQPGEVLKHSNEAPKSVNDLSGLVKKRKTE